MTFLENFITWIIRENLQIKDLTDKGIEEIVIDDSLEHLFKMIPQNMTLISLEVKPTGLNVKIIGIPVIFKPCTEIVKLVFPKIQQGL